MSCAGCGCNILDNITLEKPYLSINNDKNELSFVWDDDAKNYILYENDTKLTTLNKEDAKIDNTYVVSITSYLTEYRVYNFKVVAYINEKVNKASNVVQVLHQDQSVEKDANYGNIVNGSELAPANLKFNYNNFKLSWDEVEEAESYFVSAIYSTDSIFTFETSDTSADVFNYLAPEITAFRVATNTLDGNSYYGDLITVNLVDVEAIYKDVYYFDGTFNDYYITSGQDFIRTLYYSFISKDDSVDIYITNDALVDIMGELTYLNDDAFKEYINAITETCYYNFDYRSYSINKYRCLFNYFNINESQNYNLNVYDTQEIYGTGFKKIKNYTKQSDIVTPYYTHQAFTARDEQSTFASDNKMIVVPVDLGEELYWAVESGATPLFSSKSSSAYKLYTRAKEVINEVVSDDMTEYEKVLSLYDYIAFNSVYDYYVIYHASDNPTIYHSFYLQSILGDNDNINVAVCDGYSKTYSLLLNMIGIDAYRVTGMAQTGSGFGAHAWNKVKVNNKWYVCDITWTETQLQSEVTLAPGSINAYQRDVYEILGHTYFLVNDDFILDHYDYTSKTDRARFRQENGYSTFSNYFPSVYLKKDNNESTTYMDYYHNTTFEGGISYSSGDYYIDSASDLQNLFNYLIEEDVDNAEFAVVDDGTFDSIEGELRKYANRGYDIYSVREYNLFDTPTKLYVFTKSSD